MECKQYQQNNTVSEIFKTGYKFLFCGIFKMLRLSSFCLYIILIDLLRKTSSKMEDHTHYLDSQVYKMCKKLPICQMARY